MKKRGAIEIQFNWIFVLIAGALILAFFVMVANMQIRTSELEAEAKLRTNLNSVFNSARNSPGTIFEITMKKAELKYNDCYEGIWVGSRVEPIPIRLVFAPNLVKSVQGRLFLWALDWDMPYKVDNFMFITSPDVRYVIVNSSVNTDKYALGVFNATDAASLPDKLNKVLVNEDKLSTIPASNYYKTRFVFFEPGSYTLHSSFAAKGIDASAVMIVPSSDGLDGYGKVTFQKKQEGATTFTFTIASEGESSYIGRASVFGAIFAENRTMYECAMRQAINRLRTVTTIYLARTDSLETRFAATASDCGPANTDIYPLSYDYLQKMLEDTNTFSISSFANIYSNALELKTLNRKATMLSCPVVY